MWDFPILSRLIVVEFEVLGKTGNPIEPISLTWDSQELCEARLLVR
jgi:hypothetical protein